MRNRLIMLAVAAVLAALAQLPKPGNGSGGGAGGSSLVAGTDYAKPTLYNTYANIAASTCGATEDKQLAIPSTGGYDFARCNGSVWQWFYRGHLMSIPPSSGWTTVNGSTETFSTTNGYIYFQAPASGSTSIRARVRGVTAPYTATVLVRAVGGANNYWATGIVGRQSSNEKLLTFGEVQNFGNVIRAYLFTNPTTYSTEMGDQIIIGSRWSWLRIADDNTNRTSYYSLDGENWIQYRTEPRADFITIDQVGVFAYNENNLPVAIEVLSFLIE